MIKEDIRHKNHILNPRKWPIGTQTYNNPSKECIWNKLSKHEVMLSLPEQMFIQDIPRLLKNGNYANLGHSKGGSAILLASGIREYNIDGQVYSIDLHWKKGSEALLHNLQLRNKIIKCEGSTDEFADIFSSILFNFVFIDADHCYEAVVRDFNNWSKMVKVLGLVAFHDTNQDFSHKAIEDTVIKNNDWVELKNLHIHRIRTFEKIK